MSPTAEVGRIRSFIRESVSPKVTTLSGKLFLGNGLDRASLISTLRVQNYSPIQQSEIIRVLESERVIKSRFRGQANSFEELEKNLFMVSASLTPEKLDAAINSINQAALINLAPVISAGKTSGLRSVINETTNTIWKIRESLAASESVSLRAQEMTAVLTKLTARTVNLRPVDNKMAIEIGDSINKFWADSDRLIVAIANDHNALLHEAQRTGLMVRNRSVSAKEKDLYKKVNALLNAAGTGQIGAADLLTVITEFESVPELKGRAGRQLRKVTTALRESLNASNAQEAEFAFQKSILTVNDLLRHPDTKNWPLRMMSLAAIIFSAAYIGYRLWTLTTPGYVIPSYLAALALISAEAFCNWSSIINNLGVAKALFKTDGANGQSWLGKRRSKLDRDPFNRPKAALFLSSYNEPVGTCLNSARVAIRAVWKYGAASLKILDDSKMLYNYFGILHSVRQVRQMSAIKEIITQIATHAGVSKPVVCHEISTTMASRKTELDDSETRRFGILRAAQDIARSYNIYEKKVMRLAERIWEEYKRSAGAYDKPGHVTAAYILKKARALKIPEEKALQIAAEIEAKIDSLTRQSRIAKLSAEILDGKKLSATDRTDLIERIQKEHKISATEADTIVKTIESNYRQIKELSRSLTDEYEMFDSQQRRGLYYQAHLIMEDVMKAYEMDNNIEVDMVAKYSQIAEWLFRGKYSKRAYLQMAEEITAGIAHLPKLSKNIETIFKPGVSFEEADRQAWEQREKDIRKLIAMVGQVHGLSTTDIAILCDGRNENLGGQKEIRKPGIIDNLKENREERKAAALELCQYLAEKVASGLTAKQTLDNYMDEKGFFDLTGNPRGKKEYGKVLEDVQKNRFPALVKAFEAEHKRTAFDKVNASPTLGNFSLLTKPLIERINEYAEMVHRDGQIRKYQEKSGKAGAINNSIHGLTVKEQIAEMLRQVIHKRIEERYFGEKHIPEEIITDIDRKILDQIPMTFDPAQARAEKVAQEIVSRLLIAGNTPDIVAADLKLFYAFPPECADRMGKELLRIAREVQARMMIQKYYEAYVLNNNANVQTVLAADAAFTSLSWNASRKISRIAEKIKTGKLSAEQIQHWIIYSRDRNAPEIVENIIAIRRLPEVTLKTGESLTPELKRFAPAIDASLVKNDASIKALMAPGVSVEQVAEQAIKWAKADILYSATETDRGGKKVAGPLEQFLPQMSGLKYKIIGCFDADYRINSEALEEMVPYFIDHGSYFFLGKRQFGRNYTSNNTARVMQNAQDGFWGFQNVASSLYNNTASWGSCVFHSTQSYLDSSKWVEQKDYYGTFYRSPYFELELDANPGLKGVLGSFPKGKYAYIPRSKTLTVSGAMTLAEKTALEGLYAGDSNNLAAIDHAYNKSQKWHRHTAKITDSLALQNFLKSAPFKGIDPYKYRYENNRLIINGKMSVDELKILTRAVTSDREKRRLEIMSVNSNHNWYYIWDNTKNKWTEAKKFTPLRVINSLQNYTEQRFGFNANNLYTKLLFSLAKTAILPAHILYVLFGARLRNTLHDRGLRGKSLRWERSFDARGRNTIDMLASQDHRTESEDIASCMWDLRKMPYVTGGGQPLARSGFVEGTGGLGSHADDYRAYEATDLTRWRRGNLALLPEIENTKMTFMTKRRYLLLAKYWLLGTLRLSFIASPVVFAFAGLDPIIVPATGLFGLSGLATLGIMAFSNFFINMGAYLKGMGSRGHDVVSALRSMFIDYYMTVPKAKSVVDGYNVQEASAFVASPKKGIVPLIKSHWKLAVEHAFAGANLLAAAYSTWFGIQTLEPDIKSNIPKFFVPFWSLFTAGLIEGSIFYMNRGVLPRSRSRSARTSADIIDVLNQAKTEYNPELDPTAPASDPALSPAQPQSEELIDREDILPQSEEGSR